MSTKPAGRAVGTRGHILTGYLERTLHKQPPLGASPAVGSLPQPCPSSTQKNDTCFPLLHTSPSSEAPGWDCPEGWTVSGLVSVRRAPHFKGTPSPCDIVKSRVGMSAEPETAPREGVPPKPITSPSASALDSEEAQKGVTPPFICSFISSFYLSPIHSFNKCDEGEVMAVPPQKGSWGINSKVRGELQAGPGSEVQSLVCPLGPGRSLGAMGAMGGSEQRGWDQI